MKNSLRNAGIIAAFIVGSMGLAACTDGTSSSSGNPESGQVQVEGLSAEAAALTVEAFFDAGAAFSWADYEILSEAIEESGLDGAVTETPIQTLELLSESEQKEIAENFRKINHSSEFIDYDGLNSAEQATLDLFMVYTGTVLSEEMMGQKLTASFPIDGIEVEGDTAIARLSALEVYSEGSQSGETELLPTGMGDDDILFLKADGNTWKIDGRATLDNIMSLFEEVASETEPMSGEVETDVIIEESDE